MPKQLLRSPSILRPPLQHAPHKPQELFLLLSIQILFRPLQRQASRYVYLGYPIPFTVEELFTPRSPLQQIHRRRAECRDYFREGSSS